MKKLICAILISFTLIACSPQDKISGKWVVEEEDVSISMTFDKDGTVTYAMGSYSATGTYTIDGDQLTLSFETVKDMDNTFTYTIDGNEMTLTTSDGETTTLSKQ